MQNSAMKNAEPNADATFRQWFDPLEMIANRANVWNEIARAHGVRFLRMEQMANFPIWGDADAFAALSDLLVREAISLVHAGDEIQIGFHRTPTSNDTIVFEAVTKSETNSIVDFAKSKFANSSSERLLTRLGGSRSSTLDIHHQVDRFSVPLMSLKKWLFDLERNFGEKTLLEIWAAPTVGVRRTMIYLPELDRTIQKSIPDSIPIIRLGQLRYLVPDDHELDLGWVRDRMRYARTTSIIDIRAQDLELFSESLGQIRQVVPQLMPISHRTMDLPKLHRVDAAHDVQTESGGRIRQPHFDRINHQRTDRTPPSQPSAFDEIQVDGIRQVHQPHDGPGKRIPFRLFKRQATRNG